MKDETLDKAAEVCQGNSGALTICRALLQLQNADEVIDKLHRDGPRGADLYSAYRGGAWTARFDSFDAWVLEGSGA